MPWTVSNYISRSCWKGKSLTPDSAGNGLEIGEQGCGRFPLFHRSLTPYTRGMAGEFESIDLNTAVAALAVFCAWLVFRIVNRWGAAHRPQSLEKQGPDETCPNCGAVYGVIVRLTGRKNSGSFQCQVCGEKVMEWTNLTVAFTLKPQPAGQAPAPTSNAPSE